MQVNTEVYGAESTWRRDADGFSYSSYVPYDLQFKRGEYDTIANYCTASRLEVGKPIDYSICYAAHGEGMPLSSMRTWNMDYNTNVTSYKRNKETGWFFGHSINGGYQTRLVCSHDIFANNSSSIVHQYYWTPDGTIQNYPKQPSARLIPIVEFNTKGCYFGINCRIFNPSNGQTQYKYLSELQSGDWSAWKILSVWGELYVYRNSDADYSTATAGSSNKCCVCPNEPMEFIPEGTGNNALPVLNYNIYEYNSHLPIFGWIDNEWSIARIDGVYHCMQRVFETSTVESSYAPIFIDTVPNATFNAVTYQAWGKGFEGYCDINVVNLEAIRKAAAAYGLFFTEKDPSISALRTNSDRWISNDMFCGLLDENSVGHGEYTRGTGNRDNPVYSMGSSQNSRYNPGGGGGTDPNTYSLTTGFNSLSGGASATQRYVLDDSNVRQLLTDLWTITHTIADVDYDKFDYKILDSFLVTDPINSIVSLKRYPFNIPHTFSPTKTNVNLGKNQGEALGYLSYNVFNSIQFAGVSIYPKFGKSFLDYSPYTEYELYIPFSGTVKLDPGEILDHVLSVRMEIDLISGVCISYILADNLVIETVTGSVAADMQVAGTDAATADAAIQNAVINHTTARTNKEVAMVTPYTPGGIMGELSNPSKQAGAIANAKTNLEKANYDITHINTPVHTMGTAGGLSSWIQEFNCRLMIYYPEGDAIDSSGGVSATSPKLADLTEYGHTTGFYCVLQGSVSDFAGYTLGNIDTSSIAGATNEEREQIKSAFAQGVWLPMPEE